MPTFTITGESGKGLDATPRTLDNLGIDSCTLEFASLADDVLTFSMKITSAAGAGVDGVNRIPTAGQKVTLHKDGALKFTGHATEPEIDLDRITVRCVGPWWWMSQIPISSAPGGRIDAATDADGTRPVYAFPTQELHESLRDLANAARAAGVPIQDTGAIGATDYIAPMFTTLKTTISGRSWGDALAEMLSWCPDAVAWFRYNESVPVLHVSRRSYRTGHPSVDWSPLVFTIGDNVTVCKIKPRLDLQVTQVNLDYMTRTPGPGWPRWARQSYGSATAGKVQMVPISGPDVSDLVPKDDFESVTLKTLDSATPGTGYVKKHAANIAGLIEANGQMGGVGRFVSGYTGSQWARGYVNQIGYQFPGVQVWNPDGSKANRTGKYLVTSNDTPEWFHKAPFHMKKVRITGTWIGVWTWAAGQQVPSANFNVWYQTAPSKGQWWSNDWNNVDPPVNYRWFAIPWECEGYLVSVQKTTAGVVYRPWEWDYLKPPANLAQNLRSAQSWLPWEGTIETVDDDVSCDNVLGRPVRVNGSISSVATMDALLKRVSYDLLRSRTTYSLGAPARIDFGSFISRMRSQKIDRIYYL